MAAPSTPVEREAERRAALHVTLEAMHAAGRSADEIEAERTRRERLIAFARVLEIVTFIRANEPFTAPALTAAVRAHWPTATATDVQEADAILRNLRDEDQRIEDKVRRGEDLTMDEWRHVILSGGDAPPAILARLAAEKL